MSSPRVKGSYIRCRAVIGTCGHAGAGVRPVTAAQVLCQARKRAEAVFSQSCGRRERTVHPGYRERPAR